MSTAQTYSAIAASGALILSIFNTFRAEWKGRTPKHAVRVDAIPGGKFRMVNSGRKMLIITHVTCRPNSAHIPEFDHMVRLDASEAHDFTITPFFDYPFPTSIWVSAEGVTLTLKSAIPPPSAPDTKT